MASMICCVARNVTFGCIAGERKALLKFKASLLDPSDILSSWNHNKDCCTWQGVNCNKVAGHVIGLNLSGSYKNPRVDGLMWATNLSSLEHLDMSGVNLSRTKHLVKVLNLLPSLVELRVSGSGLDNTHLPHACVDNSTLLTNVKYLDLSSNSFEGEFPCFLQNMTSLRFVDLSHNKSFREHMNGSIHESLCGMKALIFLDLSKNHLSGNLPNCWGNFQFLRVARFSSNRFSGVIPNSIGGDYSLAWLHLNNNSLTGHLPSTLKNCTMIMVLDVGDNNLSCKLPEWVGKYLLGLAVLRLRNNEFYGVIPSMYCQLHRLQIMDLADNKLTRNIPHCFGNFSRMISKDEFLFNT
ncbi:hypothetical protein DH2020_005732 [Rehmannia glutinosa]|uniref:Leucine-rich repeat-containing N-terminal plant-type domain-containing protein n=1 Tax=Rehmannia glutinosa TaxID=99300 RepID=A0ABR0XGT7_REHGL